MKAEIVFNERGGGFLSQAAVADRFGKVRKIHVIEPFDEPGN
jgi:hypothetical protein